MMVTGWLPSGIIALSIDPTCLYKQKLNFSKASLLDSCQWDSLIVALTWLWCSILKSGRISPQFQSLFGKSTAIKGHFRKKLWCHKGLSSNHHHRRCGWTFWRVSSYIPGNVCYSRKWRHRVTPRFHEICSTEYCMESVAASWYTLKQLRLNQAIRNLTSGDLESQLVVIGLRVTELKKTRVVYLLDLFGRKGLKWWCDFIQGWRTRCESNISSSLFLMLIKGMRRWCEFKIFLRNPRDGKILLRSSTSCYKVENVHW